MSPFVFRAIALASSCLFVFTAVVGAQVPTATGRSFNLSQVGTKVFIPDGYVQRPGSAADLIVHYHGLDAAVRNNVVYANRNAIVVTVNLGTISSHYQSPYVTDPTLFGDITAEALTTVRAQADFPDNTNWDKIALSSFSAGYGAVREILKNPTYVSEINALVSADTIYASYTNYPSDQTPLDAQMTGFRSFAQAAKNGTKTMVLSHSQVFTGGPSGYCNTVQTADDILATIGLTATPSSDVGLGSLQLYRYAHSGNFTLYGATGGDETAHLKHLNFSAQFFDDLPLATVPEPSAAMIFLLGAPLALRRRR